MNLFETVFGLTNLPQPFASWLLLVLILLCILLAYLAHSPKSNDSPLTTVSSQDFRQGFADYSVCGSANKCNCKTQKFISSVECDEECEKKKEEVYSRQFVDQNCVDGVCTPIRM